MTTRVSPLRGLRKLAQWDLRQRLDRPRFHLISVIGVGLLTYWGLWRCYFATDDFWLLGWVRFKTNLWAGMMTETSLGYGLRPLMDMQLWVRTALFGLNAALYHWVSIGQHLLVTALLYWLAVLLGFKRVTAWLSALLFITSFAGYSVVHWITGSNYGMACIPGLLALCLLVVYRKREQPVLLLLSVFSFGIALFTNEAFLSILPLFVLYDLFLTLPGLTGPQKARKLLVHLWYLVWVVLYLAVYLNLPAKDGSEYSGLSVGSHILRNYVYLVYMMVPNIAGSSVAAYLGSRLPGEWFVLYSALFWFLLVALLFVSASLLWRGTNIQRYLVAWIFVAFFPFTLWPFESGLSVADRYRYVPAMAFFMLLALGISRWWRHPRLIRHRLHLMAPVFVASLLLFGVAFHQLLNRQETGIGETKQQVVRRLQDLDAPPAGSRLVFVVPSKYFSDLKDACSLLYNYPLACTTCLRGDECPVGAGDVYYRLEVSQGAVQVNYEHQWE